MKARGFENLDVYRLSERLADAIWHLVRGWDRLAQDTVGKQLIRAAASVGANIAEGEGRYLLADNCRFVRIARGSLNETRHFMRRAFQRQLFNETQIAALSPIIKELGPRLNAYHTSLMQRITEAKAQRSGRKRATPSSK